MSEVVDAYREGKELVAGAKNESDARNHCATNREDETCKERRTARLNEIIYVKVANLKPLLDRSNCLDATLKPVPNCASQNIVLFVNGRPMKGLFPESGAPELESGGEGTLRYHLTRYQGTSETEAKESNEHWADLLGLDPAAGQFGLVRGGVNVSVGLENDYPIKSAITDFRLRRMRGRFLVGFLLLAVGIIWGLTVLARRSDILRDRKPVLWGQQKPYSLSATQAAWWFMLTIMSFVFIWVVTGAHDLSTSVLLLLGIGFGTALGSTVIDQNKRGTQADGTSASPGDLETLLLEVQTLEAALERLRQQRLVATDKAAIDAELEATRVRYGAVARQIREKFPNAIGPRHESFLLDVLSDANGVNFHRFQMAVWTVVLGFVFVYSVLSRLAMPVFSETLLGLMGLSAATFLGFKIPENNSAPVTEAPAGGGGRASAG